MIDSDKFVSYYESPIGVLKIKCNEDAITSLVKTDEGFERTDDLPIVANDHQNLIQQHKFERTDDLPIVAKLKKELDEYFIGERKVFDLPLKFNGTEFQEQVWGTLLKNTIWRDKKL